MTNINEQRWCIECCQKVAQSDTIRKVQEAFGDEAMGVADSNFGNQSRVTHGPAGPQQAETRNWA